VSIAPESRTGQPERNSVETLDYEFWHLAGFFLIFRSTTHWTLAREAYKAGVVCNALWSNIILIHVSGEIIMNIDLVLIIHRLENTQLIYL